MGDDGPMARMPRSWRRALGAVSLRTPLLLIACSSGGALAAEQAPVAVTDVGGEVEMRYFFDSNESRSRRLDTVEVDQTIYELETGATVQGYVYHPNFMRLVIGGSTVYVRNLLDEVVGEFSSDDVLWNVSTRFSFLEKKPYPFTLYYERDNPSIYPGVVERLEQVNHRAGLQFNVHRPFAPAEITLAASRDRYNGGNSFQVVKEEDKRTNLKIARVWSDQHRASVEFERNDRMSESGRRGMPIRLIEQDIEERSLDSRHVFGRRGQFRFSNFISRQTQEGSFTHDVLRIAPFMSWAHNDHLQSTYRYSYIDSERGQVDSTSKIIKAGMRYRPQESFEGNYDLYVSDEETTGLTTDRVGHSVRVSHQRDVTDGQLQLSAHLTLDRTDRTAFADRVPVVGEQILLAGIGSTALVEERIFAATIVVMNATRSQTYVSGVDYRIVVIGIRTEIERVAGGNILDGEEVVVDYEYASAGTLGFKTFNQAYQAHLNLFENLQMRMHYRNSNQDVTSGNPIFTLNSIENWLLGVRVRDSELTDSILVGVSAEIEKQQEDITPFDRYGLNSHLLFKLPRSAYLRLAASYTRVDNHGSVEDVDRKGLRLLLRARPWRYTLLTAEVASEFDTGPTLNRRITTALVNLNWGLRRLSFNTDLRYVLEEEGDYRRGRTSIRATLTRDI